MRRETTSSKLAIGILVLGLVIAMACDVLLRRVQQQERQERFAELAGETLEKVRGRMEVYEYGLRGARGTAIAAGLDELGQVRFRKYMDSRSLEQEFPGAHGFGLIRRVPRGQESAFERRVRRLGQPQFKIRELSAHDGDRWVIQYIEPEASNQAALGLDVASEARRLKAMMAAAESGRAVLSAPVSLAQADGNSAGLLFLLPIFAEDATSSLAADGGGVQVAGFAFAPLLMDEVMAKLALHPSMVAIRVSDDAEPPGAKPLFQSPDYPGSATSPLRLPLALYGQRWHIDVAEGPRFAASLNHVNPDFVALGLAATFALLSVIAGQQLQSSQRRRQAGTDAARLATIVEGANDAIISKDMDGVITSWNPAATAIFGFSAEQAIGRPIGELIIPPEFRDEERRILDRLRHGESMPHFATTRQRADGQRIAVSVTVSPVRDGQGHVIGAAKTVRDITEQVAAEARIRELNASLEQQVQSRTAELDAARRMLRSVLDAVPSMIGYWDKHLINRVANHAYADWFGVIPEDLPGRHIADLLGPQLFEANRPLMEAALHGEAQTFQRAIPRPDGQGVRHSLAQYLPDVMDGEVRGFYVLVHDVTEIAEQRMQIAASERLLHSLLDIVPGMILYCGADQRCIYANESLASWAGLDILTVKGRPMRDLLGDALHERYAQAPESMLDGGRLQIEWQLQGADGRRNDVWVHFIPRREDGVLQGIFVLITDVTEIKQAQLRLERLNVALLERTEQAQSASRAKGEFLANMSHEIRTPLNAILGMCYLLLRHQPDPASAAMVRKIDQAGRNLLAIINDILDLSKVEARHLDIENMPFRLEDVLNQLANVMSTAVGGKPVEAAIGPVPEQARFLKGDALRLSQILSNLISNALKFTERGQVLLTVTVESVVDRHVGLKFAVTDSGIGIPADKLDSIFNAFSQADSSTTRRFGGTGLGLTISRQLAELMGGSLQVSSELGRGSCFVLHLSFDLSEPDQSSAPLMLHQSVLLADDHDEARELLAGVATSLGWQVDVADSGSAAISLTTERDPRQPYDVILLDWRMPVIDGMIAAQTIRARAPQGDPTLIIMVTAHDSEQVLEQPGADAIDSVLCKPITASALYNAVLEAKQRRGGAARPPADRVTGPRLSGVRVLVADDSEINRVVAQEILHGEGAVTSLVDDGLAALNLLLSRPDDFDLVLMDVQMPVMDGYAATAQIRAAPSLSHLKVVALTAGAFSSQRQAALAAGMDAHLAKPFDVEELVKLILTLLSQREPAKVANSDEASHAAFANGPAIRISLGRKAFKDEDSYRMHLQRFSEEFTARLAALNAADAVVLASLAHAMKSPAAYLGLLELNQVAEALEVACGSEGARFDAELAALHVALQRVRDAIAQTPELRSGPPSATAPGA